ncbi:hypothetical protein ACFLSE_09305 [Bacteroidota bacterium]
MNNKKHQNIFHNIMDETEKIWPMKSFGRFITVFLTISILAVVIGSIYDYKKTKREVYETELNYRLGESILTPNYRFYKINGEWYAVQGQINANICPNDSISKKKNSFDIYVFESNGTKRKYGYSSMTFEPIENNAKLKRYFRINADTLTATFDCEER